MKWAFLGSSANAPAHVRDVLPSLGECRTITANAGIKLLPTPDVYFLSDRVACLRYNDLARAAKAGGSHMVTMFRDRRALAERKVDWFDEFVQNGVDPPLPNRWGCFNQSGPFAMEYACRQGATEMHLLGCEGYNDTLSYFDQHERPTDHRIADSETLKQLVKRVTMVVQCFVNVAFYVYGSPCYVIDSPNWNPVPKCRCGDCGLVDHPCPYAEEINGDDSPCNCCDGCARSCARDI